jgi:hypothetical protein
MGVSEQGGTMPKDVLGQPVVTAEQMDAMTPEQRRDTLVSRIVWDLNELPQDVAADVRAKGAALVAQLELPGGERPLKPRDTTIAACSADPPILGRPAPPTRC